VEAERDCAVVLVTMPFGPLLQPSLALSLLRSVTEASGAPTRLEYLNIRFARRIGAHAYMRLSDGEPSTASLSGEFIFAPVVAPLAARDVDGYLDRVLTYEANARPLQRVPVLSRQDLKDLILSARAEVNGFLDEAVELVLRGAPRVVGFSSVFQQQLASLALAKRVKEVAPDTVVVFGGANCEGPMGHELLTRFAMIDIVVPGEGEVVFPTLVDRVRTGRSWYDVPGLLTRRTLPLEGTLHPTLIEDLDSTPEPDYDDYFAQLDAVALDLPAPPRLLFEGSRGCWWGERKHCTFCGLNGGRMRFRSKSPRRVVSELKTLRTRYPGLVIGATDTILDMSYFEDVLPALAEVGDDMRLFYEVKANLRKDHVRLLREAGIRDIQPGIESLADGVLRVMRKGVTALQNVQLLKWCLELGVHANWNVLWGFPGEDPADYARMSELVPLLTHLTPPTYAGPLRLDRFSPLFENGDALGVTTVETAEAYEYLYDLPPTSRSRLAYYFRAPESEAASLGYTGPLRNAIDAWMHAEGSALFFVDAADRLLVWDLRPVARRTLTELPGIARDAYLACDSCRTLRALIGAFPDVEEGALRDALSGLVEDGLMVNAGEVYLALAVPVGDFQPSGASLTRLAAAL
jgi:ribosomal peptide maturation radical SAM protein 1